MVSFARPGARSGLGSVPVSRRRFSGPLSSALLSTSTHVFFSNPTPVLQNAFIPVILSAAKYLPPVPAAPLEKKILRRCAPQDDKEREVFLGMTKKRRSVPQDDGEAEKCSSE